ncbi:hypothetical protein OH76DRAFT_382472 [Lentinus brumalis]|uniref:Uncharacterized protein n=1 Tax=Lentinus brumalis TaxID=2498619 RepID=A0A371DV35_9APHY|nr:hypothetical protein OH76DRAFT_382472 [Polyporus brumalis]
MRMDSYCRTASIPTSINVALPFCLVHLILFCCVSLGASCSPWYPLLTYRIRWDRDSDGPSQRPRTR